MVKARDMMPAAPRRRYLAAYSEIERPCPEHMRFPATVTGIIRFHLVWTGKEP